MHVGGCIRDGKDRRLVASFRLVHFSQDCDQAVIYCATLSRMHMYFVVPTLYTSQFKLSVMYYVSGGSDHGD